jgi:chromosome partitioning protein
MFKIAILGQKGGTGKTTTSIGLAVAAARAGLSPMIIDLDPQANAANWRDRREADDVAVLSVQMSRLKQTIQVAEEQGIDFMVIDTPGKSDSTAIEAARHADLVLLPMRFTIFEIETLPATRDLLRVAGTNLAFVVLNGMPPQAVKQIEEARAIIEANYDFKVCPTAHFCQRTSYSVSPISGKAPQEDEPDGKAADEIGRLYMFVTEQYNMLTGTHVHNLTQKVSRHG